jgi:predicted enzyme related to lactoylglutathione lyase
MRTEAENKIDYIEIPVRNVAASKKFFADLFGWEFTDYGPDYTSFSDGRMYGGFSKADTVASEAGGSVLIVFYRHDLEAACDAVVAAGGKIVRDIFAFPGGHRFHFSDPSGNEYALWSDAK